MELALDRREDYIDLSNALDASIVKMREALASFRGADAVLHDIEQQVDQLRYENDLADTMDESDWSIVLSENLAFVRVFDWLRENKPEVLLQAHAALGAEADAAFAECGGADIAA
jgi:hypothetical protein